MPAAEPPPPTWLGDLVGAGIEAVIVLDASLRPLYANDEALALIGYRWEELTELTALDLLHPDDVSRALVNVDGLSSGARPEPGLMRVKVADGSWRPMQIHPRQLDLAPPPHGPGSVLAVVLRDHLLEDTHWRFLADLAAGEDFAEALEAFAAGLTGAVDGPFGLAYETAGARSVTGTLPAALTWPAHLDTTPLDASDPWSRALASGEPQWAPAADLGEAERHLAATLGLGSVVVVPVHDPAHRLPALMVQCPYNPANAPLHAEALARRPREAVTIGLERRHALNQLHHLAHHDQLTGLANRFSFFTHLGDLHASGCHYGVCYIDLDRFKAVNDAAGHAAGDAVLRQVARTLTEVLVDADLVARIGGDEFAAVWHPAEHTHLTRLAEAVVEAFGNGVDHGGAHYDVGASVGVCVGTDPPDAMVAAADEALYLAKRAGRGTWRRSTDR